MDTSEKKTENTSEPVQNTIETSEQVTQEVLHEEKKVDQTPVDEPEPEIIVENFEGKDKESKSSGFFADLNASPDSMTKLLGIAGAVLAVALIAIFSIDAFMGKNDTTKNLDLNKKESQITPVQQQVQNYPSPQVYGAGTDASSEKAPAADSLKPTKASTPTATTAPTSAPQPTSAPTSTPAPTNTPEPTQTPSPSPTATLSPTPN